MRAVIYYEPKGYSVWLVAEHTGDKRELVEGEISRKATARKVQRLANLKLEGK